MTGVRRSAYWRAGGGAGKAEPVVAGAAAGAAADFCGFGFFGRMCLTAFGGSPGAGCSSATTGLGSITPGGESLKAPVLRSTCTGMVAGWYLSIVKVTLKPESGAGTETVHGVLQPGPSDVL